MTKGFIRTMVIRRVGLTEGHSGLAAPVPPGNDRLVRDEGLLANNLTPLAHVGTRAGDRDNWRACKTAIDTCVSSAYSLWNHFILVPWIEGWS
jgi:hypothetical protein